MPWSFRSQPFAVAADSLLFDEWFAQKTERTVDLVLGGNLRYVDIGANSVAPLALVAQFTNPTDRVTLLSYYGTVGTLEDDDGRSCQALLAEATEVRVIRPDSGVVRLAVTFEYVSAS